MSFNKVLFIGLGGAGQRHLRILRDLLPPTTTMFAYRQTRQTPLLRSNFTVDEATTVEEKYRLRTFDSMPEAFDQSPDLTVISTPTSLHREPLMMAMSSGSGILVEKPWAESLEGFEEFEEGMNKSGAPFLISFQRRHHPLIRKAQERVKSGSIGRPMAAQFTVYSYVPSWHGYEDWRNLYAVKPELGGGVLLTEIHEIDLAYWFFGTPQAVFCSGGNRGDEKLAVEDTVQMTLVYSDFSVLITLCFWNKQPSRSFHIAGTKGEIRWDDTMPVADDFTNDSMFVAQAKQFLSGWTPNDTRESLQAAGISLRIVDAARRSMVSGRLEGV